MPQPKRYYQGTVWFCEDCPALFVEKPQLDNHYETSHNYNCNLCASIKITSKQDFISHYTALHGVKEQGRKLRNRTVTSSSNEDQPSELNSNFYSEIAAATLLEKCGMCQKFVLNSCMAAHVNGVHGCDVRREHSEPEIVEGDSEANESAEERDVRKERKLPKIKLTYKVKNNHTCSICYEKGFKTKKSVKEHKKREHPFVAILKKKKSSVAKIKNKRQHIQLPDSPIDCKICKLTFKKSRSWYMHTRTKHEGILRKASCCVCGRVFNSPCNLRSHEKILHDIMIVSDVWRENLVRNISEEEIEVKKKEWEDIIWEDRGCKQCDKLLPYRRMLVSHMELVHGIQIPLELDSSKKLWSHENRKRQLVSCEICGAMIQQRNMKAHIKIHIGEKSYEQKCPHCGKGYPNLGSLNVHIESRHSDGHICPSCGLVLRNRRNLRNHILNFHNTNIVKMKCQVCGKEFTSEAKLRHHNLSVHLDKAKKHTCEFCGRVFKQKGKYTDHINLHTREKLYPCDICTKVFSQYKQWAHHRRLKHGIYKAKRNSLSDDFKSDQLFIQEHDVISGHNHVIVQSLPINVASILIS